RNHPCIRQGAVREKREERQGVWDRPLRVGACPVLRGGACRRFQRHCGSLASVLSRKPRSLRRSTSSSSASWGPKAIDGPGPRRRGATAVSVLLNNVATSRGDARSKLLAYAYLGIIAKGGDTD